MIFWSATSDFLLKFEVPLQDFIHFFVVPILFMYLCDHESIHITIKGMLTRIQKLQEIREDSMFQYGSTDFVRG